MFNLFFIVTVAQPFCMLMLNPSQIENDVWDKLATDGWGKF